MHSSTRKQRARLGLWWFKVVGSDGLGMSLAKMNQDRIPKIVVRTKPPRGRKQGGPRTTWRRNVMSEVKDMILTWGKVQHPARDRSCWNQMVDALCPTRDEELTNNIGWLTAVFLRLCNRFKVQGLRFKVHLSKRCIYSVRGIYIQ